MAARVNFSTEGQYMYYLNPELERLEQRIAPGGLPLPLPGLPGCGDAGTGGGTAPTHATAPTKPSKVSNKTGSCGTH